MVFLHDDEEEILLDGALETPNGGEEVNQVDAWVNQDDELQQEIVFVVAEMVVDDVEKIPLDGVELLSQVR